MVLLAVISCLRASKLADLKLGRRIGVRLTIANKPTNNIRITITKVGYVPGEEKGRRGSRRKEERAK